MKIDIKRANEDAGLQLVDAVCCSAFYEYEYDNDEYYKFITPLIVEIVKIDTFP